MGAIGIVLANPPAPAPPTPVETYFQVAADADDGDQRKNTFNTILPWMSMGYNDGDAFHNWMRFTNVTIPPGSTINSCVVSLAIYALGSNNPVGLNIYAHDVDNSANPTIGDNLKNASPTAPGTSGWWLTTATNVWNPVTTGANNTVIYTPSTVSIVQEIVDRVGWVSGNAIAIVFMGFNTGSSEYRQVDSAAEDYPARLHVNYTPPA